MTVPMTMDAVVCTHRSTRPDTTAVVDPRDRATYRELDERSADLAARFVAAGVTKGSRVGLIMPNGVQWVTVAVALTRVGAVLVPLSTLLTGPELAAQLRGPAVRMLIAVDEFRGRRQLDDLRSVAGLPADADDAIRTPELPALRRIWRADRLDDAGPGVAEALIAAMGDAVCPADPLVVLHTSGSSGTPKAVIHTHGGALAAVRSGLDARCIDADTRLYLPMPFFWVGGFGGGIVSALAAGATLVTEPIPRPESTLALLRRERVTLFRGWPEQAETLAASATEADLSTLRPGSLEALLPPALRAAPGARARLFGMTESFGPYSGFPADTDMPRPAWGSCGRPFGGMTVRIVDSVTGGAVPDGTTGVIELRGPHLLPGMCGRSREDLFTADGFYRTGDLGHLDDAGFLFFHGRADDMLKIRGATVYPGEVEQALRGLDGVRQAFVTGVPGASGVRVGAAVVGDRTVGELTAAARKTLSAFKVPTVWRVLASEDAVPRLASGKVDTAALRRLLGDGVCG